MSSLKLCKIYFNIILKYNPGSSKRSLSLRVLHQNPARTPLLPLRATCPAHLIHLHLMTIQKYVPSRELHKAPKLCSFYIFLLLRLRPILHLRPKYLPQHTILQSSHPTFFRSYMRPSYTPVQNRGQNHNSV